MRLPTTVIVLEAIGFLQWLLRVGRSEDEGSGCDEAATGRFGVGKTHQLVAKDIVGDTH